MSNSPTRPAAPFFEEPLATRDAPVRNSILKELERQQSQVELIASENIVSRAVLEAQGSVLTNKYAEGYPGKRYYGGCEFVDEIETLAIDRVKQIFNAQFANVQPHSGAQANGAVMLALTKPGDTVLGMSLDAGGHLTHGAKPALSGKWFNAIQYGVNRETMLIDYEQIEELAMQHKPTLLIAGFSAYPRELDFARLRAIADKAGSKAHGRHGAHCRRDRSRAASEPGRACACGDVDHAQDVARSAWRLRPDQR